MFVLAAGAIYTTSSDLNLILTGEQEALHLGVNVHRVKLVVYIAASVLTGLGGFGERHDRLCGPARAACDAHDVWHGLPAADSDVGDRAARFWSCWPIRWRDRL